MDGSHGCGGALQCSRQLPGIVVRAGTTPAPPHRPNSRNSTDFLRPLTPTILHKRQHATILRGSSRTIWQGKKSQNKNFDDHIRTI